MNKIFLLFIFLCLVVVHSFAQQKDDSVATKNKNTYSYKKYDNHETTILNEDSNIHKNEDSSSARNKYGLLRGEEYPGLTNKKNSNPGSIKNIQNSAVPDSSGIVHPTEKHRRR